MCIRESIYTPPHDYLFIYICNYIIYIYTYISYIYIYIAYMVHRFSNLGYKSIEGPMWLGFATFRSYPHPLHALSPISATAQRRLQGLGAAKCQLTCSHRDPLVCYHSFPLFPMVFPLFPMGTPMKIAIFGISPDGFSGRQGHRLRRSPSTPFHAWSATMPLDFWNRHGAATC
jgi:hypothetical protein